MITLVTGNPNKLKEIRVILGDMEITSRAIDVPELQSTSLEEIVRAKVRAAFDAVGSPVIVEDVSFEVDALGGMPGPFVKWWAKAAGYEPALTVCEKAGNWKARAVCGSAYCDGDRVEYAEAAVEGRLTHKSDGEGFGFDYYFVPDGYEQTFAQLGLEVKNQISHRARSLRALAKLIQ